jgi:hypothetical protein
VSFLLILFKPSHNRAGNLKQFMSRCPEDHHATSTIPNRWYYPKELANDLQYVDMPKSAKEEIIACAWEYTRCVIPQYTNWSRYISFTRAIIISIVAEFRGELIDVMTGDIFLGYNLSKTLADLFEDTPDQ